MQPKSPYNPTLHKILMGGLFLLLACTSRAGPFEEHTLSVGDATRSYLLYSPKQVQHKAPLVLVLHGGGGNGENAARMTGFLTLAQHQQFYLVFPNGSGRKRDKLLTWNAGHCCGYAMKNNVDDVGFIRQLIEHLIAHAAVDERRVYVTGMSNGGMMTHRLGIEIGHRLTAIAPVVATLFGDEPPPATQLPVLIINGALDQSVKPEGGAPGGRGAFAWDGTPTQPARYQAAYWAKANQCESTPKRIQRGNSLTEYYRCPAGSDVVFHLITDNGHAWPGGRKGSRLGDEPSTTFQASQVIWEFFAMHIR